MRPDYPTTEETVERFTAAVLKPLRDVGEMLAREVDELNGTIAAIQVELVELGRKVEELGLAAGVEPGPHSVDAGRSFYPSFCRVCGHSWESVDEPLACPECDASASDVRVGPLATVVSP